MVAILGLVVGNGNLRLDVTQANGLVPPAGYPKLGRNRRAIQYQLQLRVLGDPGSQPIDGARTGLPGERQCIAKSTEARETRAMLTAAQAGREGASGNKEPFAACAPVEHAAGLDGEPEEGTGQAGPPSGRSSSRLDPGRTQVSLRWGCCSRSPDFSGVGDRPAAVRIASAVAIGGARAQGRSIARISLSVRGSAATRVASFLMMRVHEERLRSV